MLNEKEVKKLWIGSIKEFLKYYIRCETNRTTLNEKKMAEAESKIYAYATVLERKDAIVTSTFHLEDILEESEEDDL